MFRRFVVVGDGLQCAGDLEIADILVHNHGEAQRNGSGTGGDHHFAQCAEGVDVGGYTFLCIGQQSGQVAGLDIAEDQRCADCHRHYMDDAGYIVAQRHHP